MPNFKRMQEVEWLACQDARPMLDHLIQQTSDRKFRLFAVACCRRIWDLITDQTARTCVEVAERYAEGEANKEELGAARRAVSEAFRRMPYGKRRSLEKVLGAARSATLDQPWDAARQASWDSAWASVRGGPNDANERRAHVDLVWEVFGNPFSHRSLSSVGHSWLTHEVFRQAQTVYAEKAFDRLPALADTLEKTGCTDQALLAHFRSPGPHVWGCWALDLLVGRD
jgi:hypothetical protein